jgi:hypothetical protein
MKALASDSAISLTPRDERINETLVREIPLLTLDQIARTWWPQNKSSRDDARRRVGLLVRIGFLRSFRVRAHPELDLTKPLWSWKPREPEPPYGLISYEARIRWTEALKPTTVYTASERSAQIYAGRGGWLSHPLQVTHDLHVSAIYLRLLKENPAEAAGWVSDNILAPLRRGKKLPDAEIHDADGRTLKVIEFAGSYPPERIRKVHEDCERRQVPYELW